MATLPPDRVVLLTPAGRGAVASLRIEGPRAAEFISRHFVGPKAPLAIGRVHAGFWVSAPADVPTGPTLPGTPPLETLAREEIVACRIGAEQFEVHCHGGPAAPQRIVADLVQDGCATLAWRDWIRFQEADPIRAAARALLAETRTERTATILLAQYQGALNRAIGAIIAAVESRDAETAIARIDELLARASVGLHLVDAWRVVLAGPPNAGKSSLINALVGYRRSIVHDRPGTTRDAVSVSTALDGWPVELIDTAGLRAGDDPLEIAGIERARQQIAEADAVLLVFDAAEAWTAKSAAMVCQFPDAIVVHNKIDLLAPSGADASLVVPADRPPGVAASALRGVGIEALIRALLLRLVGDRPPDGTAVPFTASQVESLHEIKSRMKRGDLSSAVAALSRIS